jgi:CHAD domain-containing protein
LKEGAYRTMLPEALQDDIDPLFAHLRKKRKKAFNDVKRELSTHAVNRILLGWEAFLEKDQTDSQGASNADMPIMILARRRILKKYRSIVKASRKIFQNIDDGAIHVLRIECKKLRYLLEFFTSLFPRSKMNKLIAQLKKVQEDLGDFNDICVQVEYLLKIADELATIDQQYNKVLMAIGSLIGTLNRKKTAIKSALGKTFDKFVSPETNRLFRKLFT